MRALSTLSLAILALAVFSGPTWAEVPSLKVAAARVDLIAKEARFSGQVVLADQTGPQVGQVWGLADRSAGRRHRTGDPWLWASVTKQVTAILVMQEVEAGHLALDGNIATYLSDFGGGNADRVTLRQLLQHTSGLPNPDETAQDAVGVPQFYRETGQAIGNGRRALGFCAGSATAEPGAGFSYNNCDYLVLGAILERVTGQSFAQLVEARLAGPLGLKSLQMAPDGAIRGGTPAVGYLASDTPFPPINVATFGAGGALKGTARDLIALDRALMAGRLLKPESLNVLWQGDPALGFEALGVWSFSAELGGCKTPVALVERRGDVAGIQVRNIIAPELERLLVVFTNDDSLDFGEVWQGKGLSFDLLSAAFCGAP